MKQKFRFEIDQENDILTLFESAEADAGTFFPVHNEKYGLKEIKDIVNGEGRDAFIEKLRKRNLFPPFDLASKLFDAVEDFFKNGEGDKFVVDYDDAESFPKIEEEIEDEIEKLDEIVEVDKLLVEDGSVSEDDIKEIDSDDDTPKFKMEDNSEFEK